MMNNFFRKELNLKKYWWHRLLFVAFVCSFVICISYNIMYHGAHDMFRGGQTQQWVQSNTLSERITNNIKPIKDLIKTDEKVAENDRTYVLNDKPDEYYNGIVNNVYCSDNLFNNFEKIKKDKNIDNLYIRSLYKRNDVLPEVFSNYIKQKNIKCLIIDAYTYNNNAIVTFLEPDKSYQNNWSFYEKSTAKTILYYVEMVLVVLAISCLFFIGILIIYYKIFIYIILGNKK